MSATPRRAAAAALFARNFMRFPTMLGSPFTSSRFLVDRLVRRIDFERARLIVEYGPGVGTITEALLQLMHPDARLVAIEANGDFVRFLREHLPDPRLHAVHGSATDVEDVLRKLDLGQADYVISGVPFSTIPAPSRERLASATRAVLRENGAFVVYQFWTAALPHLRREFRHVRQELEPRNPLAMRIYHCEP